MSDDDIFNIILRYHLLDDDQEQYTENLIKFARAIAAQKREECAVLCETEYAKNDGISCAEAIRARSE